jgi:hypothetical protein
VQKIDPEFLFKLGSSITPLRQIENLYGAEIVNAIVKAHDAVLAAAVGNTIYQPSLKQSPSVGERLCEVLRLVHSRTQEEDWEQVLTDQEIGAILAVLVEFEGTYITELRNAAIYYIAPHSAFDIEELIANGEKLFPRSLNDKVPAAMRDVKDGAKALAYHLWTASGYHFHRANETVLRAYFDHVAVGIQRDPKWTMGKLVKKMIENKAGKRTILAALENIIEFHRNPLAHPGDFIEDADEAVSLYAQIRSAMGYMLDELPSPPPPVVVQAFPTQINAQLRP